MHSSLENEIAIQFHQQKCPNLARPSQASIGSPGPIDLACPGEGILLTRHANIWPAMHPSGQLTIGLSTWPGLAISWGYRYCQPGLHGLLGLARPRNAFPESHFLARSHQSSMTNYKCIIITCMTEHRVHALSPITIQFTLGTSFRMFPQSSDGVSL